LNTAFSAEAILADKTSRCCSVLKFAALTPALQKTKTKMKAKAKAETKAKAGNEKDEDDESVVRRKRFPTRKKCSQPNIKPVVSSSAGSDAQTRKPKFFIVAALERKKT